MLNLLAPQTKGVAQDQAHMPGSGPCCPHPVPRVRIRAPGLHAVSAQLCIRGLGLWDPMLLVLDSIHWGTVLLLPDPVCGDWALGSHTTSSWPRMQGLCSEALHYPCLACI